MYGWSIRGSGVEKYVQPTACYHWAPSNLTKIFSYWATIFHTHHLNLVVQVGSVVCTPQEVSKARVQATPSSNEVMASVHLHYIFPKMELNQYL
jgi:hypothetical protein